VEILELTTTQTLRWTATGLSLSPPYDDDGDPSLVSAVDRVDTNMDPDYIQLKGGCTGWREDRWEPVRLSDWWKAKIWTVRRYT
jgi:hypothetical protein